MKNKFHSLSVYAGITGSLQGTSSWADNSVSSSYAVTASYALNGGTGASFPYTGSAIVSGSLQVTGSVHVTGGITGSVFGTSSWADNATSASFSTTSSYASTASYATTASQAIAASGYVTFPFGLVVTGSLIVSASGIEAIGSGITGSLFGTSSWAQNAISSSFATTASYALNSTGATFPYTGSAAISGSLTVTGSISTTNGITGSLQGTSSWAESSSVATSSSFATTASYAISSSVSLRSAVQSSGSAPSTPINNELWYDNNTGKTYIYYVSASIGQWVLQSDPTYDPGPSLQNLQDVTDLGSVTNNVITITNTTPSTSTTTGALKISGGVGVSGSIYAEKLTATQISGSIVSASAYIGQKSSVIYVIDGGGLTIQTGIKGDLYIPFDCTVTEWVLLTDQVGSIVIDVWSDIYGSYPPTIADSIAGTDLPTLSGVNKNKSTALTGWNKNISAGSTLRFNVNSASSVTRVTLTLNVTKT